MSTNPETRLGFKGASEVKAHPVFRGLEWANLLEFEPTFIPRTDSAEDTAYFDSRGLTLKDLEVELLEKVSPGPETPSPRSILRKTSCSPKQGDFDDFSFKNADHLREQK